MKPAETPRLSVQRLLKSNLSSSLTSIIPTYASFTLENRCFVSFPKK